MKSHQHTVGVHTLKMYDLLLVRLVLALDNGVGRTPAMGTCRSGGVLGWMDGGWVGEKDILFAMTYF